MEKRVSQIVVGFAAGLVAVVVVLLILALLFNWRSNQERQSGLGAFLDEENSVALSPEESAEDAGVLTNETAEQAVEAASELMVEPIIEEQQTPEITTFRLYPDGQMLVAGRSFPGWETMVRLDADVIATFLPEGNGEFVEFFTVDPSDDPRVLSLSARSPETGEDIASDAEIIIAPLPAIPSLESDVTTELGADDELASLSPDTDQSDTQDGDGSDTSQDPVSLDEPETAALPSEKSDAGADQSAEDLAQENTKDVAGETPAEASDQATRQAAVLLSDEEGISLVQSSSGEPSEAASQNATSEVVLDTISYSPDGDVELTGRAAGDGFIRVYVDNAPILTSPIEDDGRWRSSLPKLDSGVYTLRVDEVAADGTVLSRVETPFQREDADVLADAMEPERSVQAIIVQPGFTLWGISRERYGDGFAYVRIFEANRDLIRDPDLIYPGQVFSLPQ
ncbi:MAG: peptidoglycan-binding protein [Pseudomonadota bacterium]